MQPHLGGWARPIALFLGACAMALATAAAADDGSDQSPPPPQFFSNMTEGTPADKGSIPLPYTRGGPNCGPEQWVDFAGESNARNVTEPTLVPVLPDGKGALRTAIIVAPGGGFTGVRYDGEGRSVAHLLAEQRVAAFVLKYRVKCTARPLEEFKKEFAAMVASAGGGDLDFPAYGPAVDDARSAIAYVRTHAGEFNVDPSKIGFIGFSAGAITSLRTGERKGSPDAPNFVAAIYPQMNSQLALPKEPVPLFVALGSNDGFFGRQGMLVITDWQKAGGSVELHFFQSGMHGFALNKFGSTSDHWFEEFMWWLEAQKLLPPK